MEEQLIINTVRKQCRNYGKFKGHEYIKVLKKGCDNDTFINETASTLAEQGKGTFAQRRIRPKAPDYCQLRCERSSKPSGKLRGASETRANACSAYISFKFYEGISWKACHVRVNAVHCGHTFAPHEGKKTNIDSDLRGYIEYLILQGQTVSDIIVKVGEWSQARGHTDMMDRSFYPTPGDVTYLRKRTLAKTRFNENDASSVQKMCQGPMKDDILHFQNLSNANQQPLVIVIQTKFMKEQLQKYGNNSTIFVDASYKGITAYGYAFYAVIARNSHGHGVPGAYVLTSAEDVQTLTLAFNKIKEAGIENGQFKPRTIMVDKDATEIAMLRNVWPDSTIHLCWFHVLQALHRWLVKTSGGGLSGEKNSEQRNKVVRAMHTLKFCITKQEFDTKVQEQLDELDKQLGSNVVSNYIKNMWVPCAEMWSNFGRRMFHQYSNTNNLVERFFCRLKYEFLKGMVNRRVDDLLRLLKDNVTDYFRYIDGLEAAGRVPNKFGVKVSRHETMAREMMNQGLDRHFVHIGKGVCCVPSQKNPELRLKVNVVEQTCSSFACCGVRCKHIHFAELALLKTGTNSATLIESAATDVASTQSYFYDEDRSLLTVLSDNDEHAPEIYDCIQNVCCCTTASFGLKCVGQFCWEIIRRRQPPSNADAYPNVEMVDQEPHSDTEATAQVSAHDPSDKVIQMGTIIDDLYAWKNSENFQFKESVYKGLVSVHSQVFSQYESTTKKRKNASVIKYRPKKKKEVGDHHVYTLEVGKGALLSKRPVRSYNKDGSFKIKKQSSRVIQKSKRSMEKKKMPVKEKNSTS